MIAVTELIGEIDETLERMGIGRFDPATVTTRVGRNQTWTGYTVDGLPIFVKRLIGSVWDVAARLFRTLSFESFRAASLDGRLRTPRLLGFDSRDGLIVYELISGVRSGAELMKTGGFTKELAVASGRCLGSLHDLGVSDNTPIDRSPMAQPSASMLEGIQLEVYEESSAASLEAWSLMQSDTELIAAVRRLRNWEANAPFVAAHCDLRVDQLLAQGEGVWLTDWEEFRIADGARDVGAFAGECLHRAVLDLHRTPNDIGSTRYELPHAVVLRRGVENLERTTPIVEAFWKSYCEVRAGVDREFAKRATAFAGWHLFDRMMAGATMSVRLSGISRASAGIGRAVLTSPDEFTEVIGLG
ncbi:class V lanthionine synthetase subunit LxmK [Nocardia asiatica]|uniref:class V lanthionine synthetase subunit LxmK n=1 Tax=Nocardia asiatica TaxID=209252 RepID=UPI0024541B98|nr:class V lanthionine synthetase subunit LxmK [Nocardia asiatica]